MGCSLGITVPTSFSPDSHQDFQKVRRAIVIRDLLLAGLTEMKVFSKDVKSNTGSIQSCSSIPRSGFPSFFIPCSPFLSFFYSPSEILLKSEEAGIVSGSAS